MPTSVKMQKACLENMRELAHETFVQLCIVASKGLVLTVVLIGEEVVPEHRDVCYGLDAKFTTHN